MILVNHKRILKNTTILYARMLLAMIITLYTSRIILTILGIENFGLYNVIVGVVAMLGFISGAMTTATQRFFSFNIGENNGNKINEIFNTSMVCHAILALLIIVICETVGQLFILKKLVIPIEKLDSALLTYHLSIASIAVTIATTPFSALLIANERMDVYAGIGVLDVILKLISAILLEYINIDKLVAYSFLLLTTSIITSALHIFTCKILYKNISICKFWDKKHIFNMLTYTAWNIWGNLASVTSNYGTNILLNIFFGPTVNAGRAIAFQANTALNSFVQNAQTAVNPQIVKLFANGSKKQMHEIVLSTAKFNFIILFLITLPILTHTEFFLSIWLKEIPPYSIEFLQLFIISSLIDSFSGPLMTSAQATGKIRLYQSITGIILLLNIPVSFYFLSNGQPPQSVMTVGIGISFIAFTSRLIIISQLINLKPMIFINFVVLRSAAISVTCFVFIFAIEILIPNKTLFPLASITKDIFVAAIISWSIGLRSTERRFILNLLSAIKEKFKK